jgi:hypothetical protein
MLFEIFKDILHLFLHFLLHFLMMFLMDCCIDDDLKIKAWKLILGIASI